MDSNLSPLHSSQFQGVIPRPDQSQQVTRLLLNRDFSVSVFAVYYRRLPLVAEASATLLSASWPYGKLLAAMIEVESTTFPMFRLNPLFFISYFSVSLPLAYLYCRLLMSPIVARGDHPLTNAIAWPTLPSFCLERGSLHGSLISALFSLSL